MGPRGEACLPRGHAGPALEHTGYVWFIFSQERTCGRLRMHPVTASNSRATRCDRSGQRKDLLTLLMWPTCSTGCKMLARGVPAMDRRRPSSCQGNTRRQASSSQAQSGTKPNTLRRNSRSRTRRARHPGPTHHQGCCGPRTPEPSGVKWP